MELGHWIAPHGHSVSLSLERPRPLPARPSRARDAKDLRFYDSWIPHPGVGATPASLALAFRQAELGYPQLMLDLLADLIQSDAHARNLFEHRERVVAHKELVINPGGDKPDAEAEVAAGALTFALKNLATKAGLEHILRVNRDGFSGGEVDWDILQIAGRYWTVPTDLATVPSRRFRIGTQGMLPVPRYPDGSSTGETEVRIDELRLYQQIETPQGHPLRPGKWITLKRQASQVARGGLGITAALYMLAKRYSWRDWIVMCERFGLPWPLVEYDPTSDQAGLDLATQIVQRIGSDGGAAIPRGMKVDIKDGVKAGDPIQDRHIAFCNNELSKLVNGSTLSNDSTGSGGASYGLGNVHNAVAWDELACDGEMVSEALYQQLSVPFARYNGIKAPPTVTLMVEPDCGPIEFMSLAVKYRNELGGKVSLRQVSQRTGLRKPLNTEDEAPGMVPDIKFTTPAGGPP